MARKRLKPKQMAQRGDHLVSEARLYLKNAGVLNADQFDRHPAADLIRHAAYTLRDPIPVIAPHPGDVAAEEKRARQQERERLANVDS